MAQKFSLAGSVDSTQDLTEDQESTSALLDGFVLRTAQIDQEQQKLRSTDYQKIKEEATKMRFDERARPAHDFGEQMAQKS